MVEALDHTGPANTTEAVELRSRSLSATSAGSHAKKCSKLCGRRGRSRQPKNPACSG